MISDDKLKNAADITLSSECEIVMVRATFIKEMAQELLAYREAECKAASWDDAPEWAVSRRPGRPAAWVYYDLADHEEIIDGKIFLDTLEERPK